MTFSFTHKNIGNAISQAVDYNVMNMAVSKLYLPYVYNLI